MFYTELQRFIAQADAATSLKTKGYIKVYKGLKVKFGFGSGNFAKVPYISFLASGQTTSKGIYPVYLYYKKQKRLILAYGVSETKAPAVSWSFPTKPLTVKEYFKNESLGVPDSYKKSYVCEAYDLKKFTISSKNDFDLDSIILKYHSTLSGITTPGPAGGSTSAISGSTPSTSATPPSPKRPFPKNLILFGPPGTGKTYNTFRYAVCIIKEIDVDYVKDDNTYIDASGSSVDVKKEFDSYLAKNQIRFTTFHQSLSYEDFIEGIKPKFEKRVMKYPVSPGIFRQICEEARGKAENYVLIIDEINRGNVAQIFGELITLIEEDKREGEKNEISAILPYSSAEKGTTVKFTVPSNLYILGTMNTADRSVEALDSALRRRFTFIEMRPDAGKLKTKITGLKATPKVILEKMNQRIEVLKDSDHQIGHSYFIGVDSVEKLMDVFQHKIIPLLQEYFFGDAERIKMVIGEDFFTTVKGIRKTVFPGYNGDVDFPDEILQIWDDAKWKACLSDPAHADFINAIDTLMK